MKYVFPGLIVVMATVVMVALVFGVQSPTMFRVGQCLALSWDRERWQTPTIIRIEEIGVSHYRTRYWAPSVQRFGDLDFTQPFREMSIWSTVPCP